MATNTKHVLVIGATGYIGGRLVPELLDAPDVRLRIMARNPRKVSPDIAERAEVVQGDTLDPDTLAAACAGVDVVYYLVHSMAGSGDFAERDRRSAENTRTAASAAGVSRIVYLGGLGRPGGMSAHLSSRNEVGDILSSDDNVTCIHFRAGVIVGSGSMGFEIVRNLVEKIPVMITPRWINTKTDPVGVASVIDYLMAARSVDVPHSLSVDIGSGSMKFRRMILEAARVMGLKRFIVPVPILSPKLSSLWLVFITPVPFSVAKALVAGLSHESVKENDNAEKYFPDITPAPYDEAVKAAMDEIEKRQVISRWCDSTAGKVCDITDDDVSRAVLRESRHFPLSRISRQAVWRSLTMLGGRHGWFTYDALWSVRGFFDKLIGGPGLSRGRRDENDLRVGDALDFWKVVDAVPGKRLLLLAQMRLPGKAWLEFDITDDELVQTAHFLPKGLWGRVYWYLMLPFHVFIFRDLGKNLLKRGQSMDDGGLSMKNSE